MTNPIVPPAESRAQKRVRLLDATRRAEQSINESLVDHSESEQDIRRRRANEEIERFLPGVTEDEQNPSGMYTPDPKYYARNNHRGVRQTDAEADWAFSPMRRNLTSRGTLPPEVEPWSSQEEADYETSTPISRDHTYTTGTGEWAEGLSPDELEYWSGYGPNEQYAPHPLVMTRQRAWQEGIISPPDGTHHYEVPTTINVGQSREDRIQLFRGGVVNDVSQSQEAPYDIDKRNVSDWAGKHRKEVSETGIENTEWKQRFDRLNDDIDKTLVPITPASILVPSDRDEYAKSIAVTNNKHKQNLKSMWDYHSRDTPAPPASPALVSRMASRGGSMRPRRRTVQGVADSFASNNRTARGVTTARGTFTHQIGEPQTLGQLDTSTLGVSASPTSTNVHDTLYSYRTPIAWRHASGEVTVPQQRFSNTTSKHQTALTRALNNHQYHSPQVIARGMLYNAHRRDQHRQQAGSPLPYKEYERNDTAHEYIQNQEYSVNIGQSLADEQYEKVIQKQRMNAAAAGRRPNSRKPFTRKQEARLEDAGQLRLPITPMDVVLNKRIMEYPISLGYSAQVNPNNPQRELPPDRYEQYGARY